ncbi:MAG: ATP-binding cassette domain-containing protein [Paracoccaceae bacterium]
MTATNNLTTQHVHDIQQANATAGSTRVEDNTVSDERIAARADLATVYTGVLGLEVLRNGLLESLRLHATTSLDGQAQGASMVAALTNMGLDTNLSRVDELHPDQWPALACMTSGQIILVLGQEADQLVIYDTTCADDHSYVPKSDFNPFFSGFLVRAELGQTQVNEVEHPSFKPDRFWDEVARFRSVVANVSLKTWAITLLVVVAIAGVFWVPVFGIVMVAIIAVGTFAWRKNWVGKWVQRRRDKAVNDAVIPTIEMVPEPQHDPRFVRCNSFKGRFELRNVSFSSDVDGTAILEIPGLDIEAGQKVVVLGANGAGTSTFLNVLIGTRAPLMGRVSIDGIEMEHINPTDLQRLIGYLGNDVRLVTGTLRDNLNLDLVEQDEERLFDALAFAGLSPFVRSHAQGLDLPIHDAERDLTKSQRQSIGWARLWLQNPKICVMDEPTDGLEQLLEATLVDRLSRWLEGRTTIVATDRKSIVALADRMLVLQHGHVVFDGPKDQVLAQLRWADSEPTQTAIAS